MTKFKKGDRVRFIEKDSYGDMDYPEGSEAVVQSHNDCVVTLTDDGIVLASRLELITDYQPITPKVGERYRVLRKLEDFGILVGRVYEIEEVKKDGTALIDDGFHLHTHDFLTTEYLELVEEKKFIGEAVTVTQTNVKDVTNQAIRAMDMASKPLYVTEMDIGKIEHGSIFKMPTLKKTKQTTMQKLTSALKRVLSADKQTLYKAGVIGSDLELTTRGQSNYTDALFNNEGDHKKAVAEMVAMAQAELDEA